MPPAQIHDDAKGGVEWFVSTDGTDAGGSSIRVTKMTNYLSSSPVFITRHYRSAHTNTRSEPISPVGLLPPIRIRQPIKSIPGKGGL